MTKHFATVASAQVLGIEARIVHIEVDVVKNTLHKFSIVGLPDKAVDEARDRVGAALRNIGKRSPKTSNQKVTVSLAPAHVKKEGPAFDIGIAVAYLAALGDIALNLEDKLFLGELSLDGSVRPIRGVLPCIREAAEQGIQEVFVPKENAEEAAFIESVRVYPVEHLTDLIKHLGDTRTSLSSYPAATYSSKDEVATIDFRDVVGQGVAKRGLEIAAAGGHNIALFGPPGTGKSLLAKAFSGILPALTRSEALEVTAIHSVAGVLTENLVTAPPFRSPHHTASHVSIVGGGTYPRPGEVTLAHRGVLFMDEFPEFDRRVIETLRQPLEDRVIQISRARAQVEFPARFILIAALNPCPCGFRGSHKECTCTPISIERYRKKLSGPIIDRIDMWVDVQHISHKKLAHGEGKEESRKVRERVQKARSRQQERFGEEMHNSDMNVKMLKKHVTLEKGVEELLHTAAKKHNLSPRAYHRVIKLSRTIADLNTHEDIEIDDIMEALQYRPKENIV